MHYHKNLQDDVTTLQVVSNKQKICSKLKPP